MSLGAGRGPPRPTIWQAVVQAWRDALAALRALSGPAQIAFFIYLVASVTRHLLLPVVPGATTATLLGEFVLSIVQAFLLTPFLIAVHRFIILGETQRYVLAPGEHRFQLFFMWSIALSLMMWVPPFLISALPLRPAPVLTLAFGLGSLVYIVMVTIVSLRLVVLFPAIAVDAPGATWRNAMADTKGNAWRILFIVLLAALPLIVLALLLMGPVAFSSGGPGVAARSLGRIAITSVFDAAAGVLAFTIAVVVASRLYEQLGNRLKQ